MKPYTPRSPIWLIPKEQLQQLLDSSCFMTEVIKSFGLDPYSGNHRTLTERIMKDNLDVSKLKENRKREQSRLALTRQRIPNSVLFSKKSRSSKLIRARILQDQLLPYRCVFCDNRGEYNAKPLSLQLDHIDGNPTNNSLENLRFLCPNCHSQTPTFGGRNTRNFTPVKSCRVRRTKISWPDPCVIQK
jgi:5-methylcytosine-specific restriction endonuclease McrA